MDDDCEDQGLMATDTCVRLMCEGAALKHNGTTWCCPRCQASYGADAKGLAITSQNSKPDAR